MTTSQIRDLLRSFLSLEAVKKHENLASKLAKIADDLCAIEYYHQVLGKSPEQIFKDKIMQRAANLRDKLTQETTQSIQHFIDTNDAKTIKLADDSMSLADALYQAALTLAEIYPINQTDFATLDKIAAEDRIVTSDRYQYDIHSLYYAFKNKIINPYTNLRFNERDLKHLKTEILARFPDGENTVNWRDVYPNGDPAIEDTMRLVRQLANEGLPQNPAVTLHTLQQYIVVSPAHPGLYAPIAARNEGAHQQLDVRYNHNENFAGFAAENDREMRRLALIMHANEHRLFFYNDAPAEPIPQEQLERFIQELQTYITHYQAWSREDRIRHIQTNIHTAYNALPDHARRVHDELTDIRGYNGMMHIFDYFPDANYERVQRENGGILFQYARINQLIDEESRAIFINYAEKCTQVITRLNQMQGNIQNNNEQANSIAPTL